ncbi:hypothetical protein [Clostridium formicaceticum]|uniref:Uncharacterized protein n=1 Tax=Clostridium formicaceticum TaxID=1497 RepID=A0AAC9WHY9_9CLOT|nr:hypothetical protein [Clostridium formicaceticum]AOY75067.1 hypothetical protein BJL90_03630 [Clostridium formicaceticum]ARE89491.1 hypothetical protein CLFO_39690 [Clostridium formicaceticum]
MQNSKDIDNISNQLRELKKNIDRSQEYLSALEMLMVDDNNGRLKDADLAHEFKTLTNSIASVSKNIEVLEKKLYN